MRGARAVPTWAVLAASAWAVGAAVAGAAEPASPAPASSAGEAPPAALPQDVVGAPRARPLAGTILDSRTEDVGGLLRCPVCQGLSVADSPATMARNMKGQVRDMLAAGYDQEQILDYFEASYGEFVRLQPPLRGVNWLVWIAPVGALLAGAVLVARVLRAPRPTEAAVDASVPGDGPAVRTDRDRLPEDDHLAAHVLRVREQVYGWPGGRSPATAGSPPDADSRPPSKPPA
ncbi:MAG TPA: cytochrome c-type biogenesis protein [Vicinamibacteria bacterium]|nr:cytochrome c-type biogenesis protein [Vicinamibacteria bacterium]